MWLLQNEEKGQVYKIKTNRENIISRKDGDLLLSDDQSISRRHAMITFNEAEQKIILKDLGSKYGTFFKRNEADFQKANKMEEIVLNDGDVVRFGIQSNLWTLQSFPIVVTTSTLGQDEKLEMKQIISTLNGTVVSNWTPQCTHLIMNQLTVTVKVVCALASCRSIVTPEYWRKLYQCITSSQLPLPDPNNFIPILVEATLNSNEVSFIPNPIRKTLFSGFVFVASTPRQFGRIEMMVTAAGGKVEEFSSSKVGINSYLNEKRILMLHSALDRQTSQESQIPNGYKTTARMLKNQGKRCIPEPDIGLSILFCSMDQYCNPNYKVQLLPEQRNSCQQTSEPSEVVVAETQDQNLRISGANIEIPETCPSSVNKTLEMSSTNKKRTFEPDNTLIQKRARRECNDDEEDMFPTPSPQPTQNKIEQTSAVKSPDLFSMSLQKDASSVLETSRGNSRNDNLFDLGGLNTTKALSTCSSTSSSSKRPNSDQAFNSIVKKSIKKTGEGAFMFPFEGEEIQHKETNKRNRDEDLEFDFPREWEDKRHKLNSGAQNKKSERNNNFPLDSGDAFNFSEEIVERPRNLEKNRSCDVSSWLKNDRKKSGEEKSTDNLSGDGSSWLKNDRKKSEEKSTDDLSGDESSSPTVQEVREIATFQPCYDQEVTKKPIKPISLSSFITKPSVKKEEGEDDEEALANKFNETVEIEVRHLVTVTAPVQNNAPQKEHSNVVNYKKFKKRPCGTFLRLPYIIGGNDLISYVVPGSKRIKIND